MKTVLFFGLFFITSMDFVNSANFYFATHNSYAKSTLNSTVIFATKIAGNYLNGAGLAYLTSFVEGNMASAMQQCRRNCAFNTNCKAFELTSNGTDTSDSYIAIFQCLYFAWSPCNWTTPVLQNATAAPTRSLWDKLDAGEAKPKSCVEHYAVQYTGNCQNYTGFPNFTGLDCDVAPKLCSDVNLTGSAYWAYVWPWGYGGRRLYVKCTQQYTFMLANNKVGSSPRILGIFTSSGYTEYNCDTFECFNTSMGFIDWEIPSFLVSVAKNKQLVVREFLTITMVLTTHFFDGLELSPQGKLSLNSSLNSTAVTGFPTPLYQVPFVYPPEGVTTNCSAFWQFEANVHVCSQRTNPLSFGNRKWNNIMGPEFVGLLIA